MKVVYESNMSASWGMIWFYDPDVVEAILVIALDLGKA